MFEYGWSLAETCIALIPIVLAITLHEAAHGYAALKLGDNTAYLMGRVTLNPIKHVDVIGTLIIPGLLFLSKAPFLIGYAKPVPVNFGQLRHPRRDMALVALAGPATNVALMLVGFMGLKIQNTFGMEAMLLDQFFLKMIIVNAFIGIFNMLPILPLDGGRVLTALLPRSLAYKFSRLEPYGMFLVLGLLLILPWVFHMDPVGWILRESVRWLTATTAMIFGL